MRIIFPDCLFAGFCVHLPMNLSLAGKTAIVCGSTSGIGRACALELASLGAGIILIARDEAKLTETAASLPHDKDLLHAYIVADFSKPDTLKKNVQKFLAEYKKPVHILVNNTGGPPPGPIAEAEPKDFIAAFNSHLICNQVLVQSVLHSMQQEHYGRIINIISTSVKNALPNLGVSNTIRAAVANWAKTLANELGQFNITVNNVLPGSIRTGRLSSIIDNISAKRNLGIETVEKEMQQQIPMKRFGEPAEVANAVAFLASPAAGYINGTNVIVDGGRTPGL